MSNFTKPWNPLKPRQGSQYLGGHDHHGYRCDRGSKTKGRPKRRRGRQ